MNRLVLFVALAVLCSCSRSGDADFINTSIGVEWNKATITHKELIDAGLIEMELSSTPTGWAAFTSAPGDNMACQP